MRSREVKLGQRANYEWSVEHSGDEAIFRILDAEGEVFASIKVPADRIVSFGFGATVRWADGETNLEVTFD